jgi:putative transcriptional regulator
MNKTVAFARICPDGTLMLITSEGSEEVLPGEPIAPIIMPAQVEDAVHQGPDAQPPRVENSQPMRSVPCVATLRCTLALTQQEFAARYHIPLSTLHDWEQGHSEPDQTMCAYLAVIARHPEVVRRALRRRSRANRARTPLPALVPRYIPPQDNRES